MKKTLIGIIVAMFSFGSASADAGVNIGLSGVGAIFGASATETDTGPDETEKVSDTDIMGASYASFFIEKELGMAFVGLDYVLNTLETEEATSLQNDCTTQACNTGAFTQVTNKVKVEFNDLTTLYVGIRLFDNFYAKAGAVSVDIDTKETLGTGSTYGNTTMDGTMVGVGGQAELPNGMFIRAEANYLDFDGASVTSSTGVNKVEINSLDGLAAKISIGATF